jgi:flavin-dependent dehydrogenase
MARLLFASLRSAFGKVSFLFCPREQELNAAVCVIGGGPAGAAVARKLAQLGHSTVVVEKAVFPRPHVGESLTPGILPLFDALDLRQRIEQSGFLRPDQTIIRWPPLYGRKKLQTEPGFQVDRGRLDTLLLQAAEEAGACLLQGAKLLEFERSEHGVWNCVVQWNGKRSTISSRFLIDASGRNGAVRGSKRPQGIATLAVWGYWEGSCLAGTETRVEAGTEEWFWGAPLPDGTFNATVFVDTTTYRMFLQVLGTPEAVYRHLLRRSELLEPCLTGRLVGGAKTCDATPYSTNDPVFPGGLRIGEASFSVDPLSSQGVQAAVGSGLHAAAVLHTSLMRPDQREVADTFYRQRQRAAVEFYRVAAANLYARVAVERRSPFWQRRGAEKLHSPEGSETNRPGSLDSETRIHLSKDTRITSTACLAGDLIVMSEAMTHPGVAGPLVFLENVFVTPLLKCLHRPLTVDQTLKEWCRSISVEQAKRILTWLWARGAIVELSVPSERTCAPTLLRPAKSLAKGHET